MLTHAEKHEYIPYLVLSPQRTREAVYSRRDGALVGEVSRYAPLVLRRGPPNEGGVEDEAVLGGVAFRLQRSEPNAQLNQRFRTTPFSTYRPPLC